MFRIVLYSSIISIITVNAFAQTNELFNYKIGLSNSLINQVYEDERGIIWVATENGLNMFDGQKFKSFLKKEKDSTSLPSNFIKSVISDGNNGLWIGYNSGISKYDYEKETFTDYPISVFGKPFITKIIRSKSGTVWFSTSGFGIFYYDSINKKIDYPEYLNNQLANWYHEYIYEDSEGILWIAQDFSGIASYNPSTGEINKYPTNQGSKTNELSSISSICGDDRQNIYIGTFKNGLFRLNKKNGEIKKIESIQSEDKTLIIKSLLFDSKKRLWVGTDGNGLRLLNKNTEKLEVLPPNNSPFDFEQSKIHSIIEDKYGNIWLGIYQKGLFLFPESPKMFKHYGYKPFGNQNIGSSCVSSIITDEQSIWIASDGDGVYQLSKKGKIMNHIILSDDNEKKPIKNLLSIYDDKKGNLWFGTYLNGLIKLDKTSHKTQIYKNQPGNIHSLPNDKVFCITSDKEGNIWVGTYGAGVAKLDVNNGKFYAEFNDSANNYVLRNRWVNNIYIDKNNNFWIAGYQGLAYAEPAKKKITNYLAKDGFLPSDVVYCIKPDTKNNLWVGTNNGLAKFNLAKKQSKIYNTENGLADNVICSIEEDEYHQIWLSTLNGLSKFNTQTEIFTNYFSYDGLQANEFSRNASCKALSNELYFGGINGVTEIINRNEEPLEKMHQILLTDFILFDKSVKIGQLSGKYTVLNKSLLMADSIEFSSADNVFTIEFTTTDFANRANIDYEYKLLGFDKNWNRCGPFNNRATYTNIDFGNYKFQVRGINKDKYTEIRELNIIIHPPWYQTNIAISMWIFLALLVLYLIFMFFKTRIKQLHIERLNELKMQFFTDISHEIKTPLSLIIDPLHSLQRKVSDDEAGKLIGIMQKNANRIFGLVDQLLAIRKIEKGQLTLNYQKLNLYNYISDIAETFKVVAQDKEIVLNIECSNKELFLWIDPSNFEKVIQNLLSNAFKFTPPKGQIDISIAEKIITHWYKKTSQYIQISVFDTGNGIPENELTKIFDRFYQLQNSKNLINKGTGIGLHLAKSMVELHKGKIFATNRTDCTGSCFTVLLPLQPAHYHLKEHLDHNIIIDQDNKKKPKSYLPDFSLLNKSKIKKPKTLYTVMIVDDEENIRDYLTMQLSDNYNIVNYPNGKMAFANLLNTKPDLIISDILMPEMDGITLCKKIKANPETFHIPIILLTALSDEEDKAAGIETGADLYITKPFNTEIIKKVIINLLNNRRQIIESLKVDSEKYNIAEIKLDSHDEMLMKKMLSIVKENIADTELNVETLAKGVGMSRSNLHRKLKAITNMSARDFIKDIRMKQASYLLINNKVSISEIAYAVGFSNISHFSRTFKEFYGVSPKEYISQNHSNLK